MSFLTERMQEPHLTELGGVFLASAIYMAQSATLCSQSHGCTSYQAWAVTWSVVCMVVCLVMTIISMAKQARPLFHIVAACVLCLFSGFGVAVGTFKNPFVPAGNGFFSGWAAFCLSFYYLWNAAAEHQESVKGVVSDLQTKAKFPGLLAVLISSFVYLIASAVACGEQSCTDLEAWAVACAVISMFACLIFVVLLFFTEIIPLIGHVIFAGFLLAWWAAGAGVGTFQGPFGSLGTANGYFSGWASFFFAAWYLRDAFYTYRGIDPNATPVEQQQYQQETAPLTGEKQGYAAVPAGAVGYDAAYGVEQHP
eukprot:CAMPEP_0174243352 /NCGR_PEP_ID=MMETSP0417-20130205/31404_1 /TAXON_ID=242541 /ORGANISM="Mayorella sp, Strain BSH-02190019" /LENGTH=309 /DNA_ID=CAMNT_0015322861 /DNA_START=113 /DNA_END=1042 /DNA_ORIENTATION=-